MSTFTDSLLPASLNVPRPTLTELQEESQRFVEFLYKHATDPDFDAPAFVALSVAGMSVPFVVPLPTFDSNGGKLLAHCRWLPVLCRAVDASAIAFASPAWTVRRPTGHAHEPRPSEHPRRTEIVSVIGVTRDAEVSGFVAEVSRKRGNSPTLGKFAGLAGEEVRYGGVLAWAHATAVGCFTPEQVERSQPVLAPWTHRYTFPDETTRDTIAERILCSGASVRLRQLGDGLVCLTDTEADSERACELMREQGVEAGFTADELSYVLTAEGLLAPLLSEGYAFDQLIGGDSLLTDDDMDLLSAAVSTWCAYLDNPTDDAVVFAGVSNAGGGVAVSPDSTGKGTSPQKAKKNNSKRKRTSQSRNARCHCGSGLKSKRCCG